MSNNEEKPVVICESFMVDAETNERKSLGAIVSDPNGKLKTAEIGDQAMARIYGVKQKVKAHASAGNPARYLMDFYNAVFEHHSFSVAPADKTGSMTKIAIQQPLVAWICEGGVTVGFRSDLAEGINNEIDAEAGNLMGQELVEFADDLEAQAKTHLKS